MNTTIQALEHVYELFPSMRHAKQPQKLPRMSGTWGLDGEADWKQFVETIADLRLRLPSAAGEPLCGPFRALGDCLDPFSREGDLCWFDPTVEPTEGDFVLVAWTDEYLASRQGKGMLEGWREQYGFEAGILATKRLSRMGPSWMLQVRSGYFDLENIHGSPNARILGVLRKIERDGRPLYQDPVHVGHFLSRETTQQFPAASQIEQNAATAVYSTSATGPVVNNNSAVTTVVATVSFTVDLDCEILATVHYEIEGSGFAGLVSWLRIHDGSAFTDSDTIWCPTTRVVQSITTRRAVTRGSSITVTLRSSVAGGQTATYRNVALLVEQIKR